MTWVITFCLPSSVDEKSRSNIASAMSSVHSMPPSPTESSSSSSSSPDPSSSSQSPIVSQKPLRVIRSLKGSPSEMKITKLSRQSKSKGFVTLASPESVPHAGSVPQVSPLAK